MSYQKALAIENMTASAMVVHREMVLRADRGSIPNAMRQIETDYGLGYWSQWAAWYRGQMSKTFADRVRRAWATMLIDSLNKDIEALQQQIEGAENAATDVGLLLSEARERLVATQKLVAKTEDATGKEMSNARDRKDCRRPAQVRASA